jgi:peptidoglycan/xylan/chitin deacetylase (PgdA/CDA1 family)
MAWVHALSSLVAASGLARSTPGTGPLIVMYHGLGGGDGVAAADFEAQLDLLASRLRIVPLHDALAGLGTPAARGLAAITFDDGYRDFAELAVPALRARGLHATLFVPAEHLGGWNAWDAGRAERREILTAGELRALDPRCVEVGAHGASHRRLRGLDAASLERETRGARRTLEDALGRPLRLFAYPYGLRDDFDAAAEAAVAAAGFEAACATHFGRGSLPSERFRLRRVGVAAGEGAAVFARKLDGAYDWTAWKEDLGVARRRLLGGAALARTSP